VFLVIDSIFRNKSVKNDEREDANEKAFARLEEFVTFLYEVSKDDKLKVVNLKTTKS
jgi:hypothetical protein